MSNIYNYTFGQYIGGVPECEGRVSCDHITKIRAYGYEQAHSKLPTGTYWGWHLLATDDARAQSKVTLDQFVVANITATEEG